MARAAAAAPELRMELVENTAEGEVLTRCEVDGPAADRWRAFYGEVAAAGRDWTPIRARSGCAAVTSGDAPGPWTLRGAPFLVLDVRGRPSEKPDGVALDLALEVRTLAGFEPSGAPRYDARVETRTLTLAGGRAAIVPLLVAGERERRDLGLRELLLRVSIEDGIQSAPAGHGDLAVSADVPRAAILVDGEVAAHTSLEQATVLHLVPAGTRRVAVRDASGREAGADVTVERNRRADVTLRLLPEPTPSGTTPFIALGRNPQGFDEVLRRRDGALLVRVPPGELQMGSPDGQGEANERPRHAVRLKGFLIDKTEVTWEQFARFAADTRRPMPRLPAWGAQPRLPASGVTWHDAADFCAWAGGRLPTEAEWERAARGDDTRLYPWGDEWNAARCSTRDGGPHAPTAVASHPGCVSPFGVLDLAGSVWEWCADWYDPAAYATSPRDDPRGPAAGALRVSRGGSWINPAQWARTSYRQGTDPGWPDPLRGFRCAHDDAPPQATDPARGASGVGPDTAPSFDLVLEARNGDSGAAPGCEVAQTSGGAPARSWAAFGAGRASSDGALDAAASAPRCGKGPLEGAVGSAAPLLILDLAATPMLDSAAMDPGPGREMQVALALDARWLSGFEGGTPRYTEPTVEQRLARLGQDGELTLPIPVADARLRAALGGAPLLRLRARMRNGAEPAPGSLWIGDAAPGSEVLLDGGAAGRVGADGRARLDGLRPGRHEVRLQPPSGPPVSRVRTVLPGRISVASAVAPAPIALTASGAQPKGPRHFRRARDGAEMIEVAAGEFLMGSLEAENRPLPHRVQVSTFLVDRLPVTWGRYRRFAAATGRPLPPAPYWGIHDDHPVVFVPWRDARAYCEWAGARLPTEAEREKAARGTDGRAFPWGNEPPTPERAVFRRDWGYEGTEVVGSRPAGASPYGLLDAGGNVWEWCDDWYDPDYYASSPTQDPPGPRTGRARVVRGGSWDSRPTVLCTSCRNWGYTGYREGDFGFRCAADVETGKDS